MLFTPPYFQGGVDAQRTGWLGGRARRASEPEGLPASNRRELIGMEVSGETSCTILF